MVTPGWPSMGSIGRGTWLRDPEPAEVNDWDLGGGGVVRVSGGVDDSSMAVALRFSGRGACAGRVGRERSRRSRVKKGWGGELAVEGVV